MNNTKNLVSKVTVITLNYNGKHFLEKHYQTLLRQTYTNYDLTLVENGSSDGSEHFVKEHFPQVKIIKLERNVGPVRGYNVGGFSVKDDSKYLIFVGNDTWFDDDWLKEMVRIAERDEKIAIVGARQMNYVGNFEAHLGGVALDVIGYPTFSRDKAKDFFYADGVSLLIRKEIFDKLGGFDDRYFVFVEEVDLAWRARLLGYKIAIAPNSVFYHAMGSTLGGSTVADIDKEAYKTTIFKRFNTEKNTLCTLLKNYSLFTLCFILPLFFLSNAFEFFLFLARGKYQFALLYPRSWFWNIKNFRSTIIKRREVQKIRCVSDGDIMKYMYKGLGKIRVLRRVGFPQID